MTWYGLSLLPAVLVVLSLVNYASCAPNYPSSYLSSFVHRHPRRDNADLEDQSWIKSWAAVGDSYAAGIGAGTRLSGIGDYFCSRYNQSYPYLMNTDERFGRGTDRKFTFWACSGALTPDITKKQIAKLDDTSQQMITVSSGGNDVGLVDILNHCIFQWNPSFFSSCDSYLTKAQKTIDSDDYAKNFDNLLNVAKAKLTADGTVYWTGYAQYFGTEDHQCDSVTWSFLWSFFRREYLTLSRRQSMNALVANVNQKISEAVGRAGDKAVFVDYDKYYKDTLARFCEARYAEPFGNRAGLLFYEYYTDDSVEPDTPDGKSASARSGNLVMNGTFEGDINALVQEYMSANSSASFDIQTTAVGNDAKKVQTNPSLDQNDVATQVSVIPDSYGRVFHPRPGGHALISNLVFYNMGVRRAKQLNQAVPNQDVISDTCPPGSGPSRPAPLCGAESSAPSNYIVAMSQPAIETAYQDFCTASNGVTIDQPDSDSVFAHPLRNVYGPDGSGDPVPNRQNIALKVTTVGPDVDGCPGSNYVLVADDCKKAFSALNNGCDTNTRTEKKGGIFNYRCLKYNLSGTGTPKYKPGWCGLHITQHQKPDPSKDAYTLEVLIKDADSMIIGNTLGAVDARNPIRVLGFGGQLAEQLIVTTGGVDADPVKFEYGDQHWDSKSKQCKMGGYDSGKREGDCGFNC